MNPSDSLRSHHDAIRAEYRVQSSRWGKTAIGEHLAWVVDQIDLDPRFSVLDVAAGTGLFSQAVANRVSRVTAVDITPEMLECGRRQASDSGITNISFQLAAAEQLPFPADSFDVVICRYAIHHFYDPSRALIEMVRVCQTGGSVVLVDMVADEDSQIAARHNQLERLADSTHTRMLPPSELTREVTKANLEVARYLSREVEMTFDQWQSQLPANSEARQTIRQALESELSGGAATGMRPFKDNGALKFWHTWGIVIARKLSPAARLTT